MFQHLMISPIGVITSTPIAKTTQQGAACFRMSRIISKFERCTFRGSTANEVLDFNQVFTSETTEAAVAQLSADSGVSLVDPALTTSFLTCILSCTVSVCIAHP